MRPEILAEMKKWFLEYVDRFRSGNPLVQRNYDLKRDHTLRVCAEISDLCRSLQMPSGERRVAETAALFHDLGRFRQYQQYGTFSDARSECHAALAVRILDELKVLKGMDRNEREIIRKSVAHHNSADLPSGEKGKILFFIRLLKDADKIDIFRVVTDYYARADRSGNSAIELDLPDHPAVSDSVLESLRAKRIVTRRHVRTLNDFKLLQAAWVYGIHFRHTALRIRERAYLDLIRGALPQNTRISAVFHTLKEDLDRLCLLLPDRIETEG
ncbi:HD domain-containing protein [bacterium]|nr:HD domain-containing protein [bacterium]